MDEQSSAHTDIKAGKDVWLADLKALNKENYLFRGFVPVQDLISLAWAKALWATAGGDDSPPFSVSRVFDKFLQYSTQVKWYL